MIDEATINAWLLRAASKFNVKLLDRDTITVTEVTFPCLRKAYFDRTRRRLPTPVEALKVLGAELHTLLEDVMRREGYEVEVSVAIEVGDFKLVGRADAVKYDDNGCATEVVEIKTSNGVKEHALESHTLQLQAYMTILGAKCGYIVYIDRASGRVKVFKARPDKRALRTVIERAKQLHEALLKHEAPPPRRGPWCGLCPHKWSCWRGGEKR